MYEGYSVLFVDDEVNILNSLKRGLIDEEYTCYFASSGKEALEIMEKNNIAVIVSDMRMPEMDGFHLFLKISERWPNTVKIILSGYTQLQQILTTINKVDIFKYITKPWKLEEEFKFAIYEALNFYKLREENEENKIALEKKNEAYQNIFRSIETIITNAKKGSKILATCGKSILKYSREHKSTLIEEINTHQDNIFDYFANAVISDKKEYQAEDFIEKSSHFIESFMKISQMDNNLDASMKINCFPKLLEATFQSIFLMFYEEFKQNGIGVVYKNIENNNFSISIVGFNAFPENIEKVELVDNKISYINSVIGSTLTSGNMGFECLNKKGSLVFNVIING